MGKPDPDAQPSRGSDITWACLTLGTQTPPQSVCVDSEPLDTEDIVIKSESLGVGAQASVLISIFMLLIFFFFWLH